jgi:hypothetical protein
MADFRRWLYAFAVVALLAGLTVPASAQNTVQCQTNTSVPPVVRSQGYAELVGDLVLSCAGGVPTAVGATVPSVNVQIFLTTNITSRLLGTAGLFSEALLIMDDPNSPGPNSNRPILNCGGTGAADTGPSGPGVCAIVSTGNPQETYDGTQGNGTYGSGRPNVFQGRPAQNNGLSNSVVFLGVPLDPPGTGTTRSLRITNVRADAEFIGVSGNFTTNSITMNIAVNGNTSLSINNPAQIVAYVQNGLTVAVTRARMDFIQCETENGLLFAGTGFPYSPTTAGGSGGGGNNGFPGSPKVQFQEGFGTSWKPKNISFVTTNGTYTGAGYAYNGGTAYPADQNQNVPGTINYNTETGFSYTSNAATPSPNPPIGIGTGPVTNNTNAFNNAFNSPTTTGIAGAGVATQGTRLALAFQNVPNGANIYVPPIIYLYRQGTSQSGGPTVPAPASAGGTSTGVMVLTSTAADGSGGFSAATTSANLQQVAVTGGNGAAVYEILFADSSSLEVADVPVVVAYASNLSANPPVGLPVTGQIATVTGSFAPFYSSAAARLPSASLPVPRFTPLPSQPINLFLINKCSCNILFPFVTDLAGFDTGIAIANTSQDPGPLQGFFATPQAGTITFYYYGIGTPTGGAAPQPQTSNLVPAGQVLTYDVFSGGGAIGANPNGIDNRASSFQGYIIAQSQFQYCHGFAFISSLGNPIGGVSEGYLGIILDFGGLPRTLQAGENDAH